MDIFAGTTVWNDFTSSGVLNHWAADHPLTWLKKKKGKNESGRLDVLSFWKSFGNTSPLSDLQSPFCCLLLSLPNILRPSHNTCGIHIPPHAPCNNLVVHQWRNEILTERGCETMFFDEGSMKLKWPWNSVMNYRRPTVQSHSSITAFFKFFFIYINC